MKNTFKFIVGALLILFIVACLLDVIYTSIHYYGAPRNKVACVRSLQSSDTLDYILLGSSRCFNNINPEIIDKETGFKGYNLGSPAYYPYEINLMVQHVLKHLSVKKIFIQVDYTYNYLDHSKIGIREWLPFIKESFVRSRVEAIGGKYALYCKIPYYRYLDNDPKIGLRSITLSVAGVESKHFKNKGYMPLENTNFNENITYKKEIKDLSNVYLIEITELCKNKGVELHFFTAPIYNDKTDYSLLNKHLLNYQNFSDSLTSAEYFIDQTHLNTKGTKVFTKQFCRYYFQ